MIVYPKNWEKVGQKISLRQIEEIILTILSEINCNCLSFSGGLDSSLLLYFMTKIFGRDIRCFTIAYSKDHPDYIFSDFISSYFKVNSEIYIPDFNLKSGNDIVKRFYEDLGKKGIKKIITGDGVDEFNCGYYDHLHNPTERMYYNYIWRLQKEQLLPLNKNSGKIKIALPYIDDRLILLFSQIPVFEKVDDINRKKVLIQLAEGKLPDKVIYRRKYGFCDAMKIKK